MISGIIVIIIIIIIVIIVISVLVTITILHEWVITKSHKNLHLLPLVN